MILTIMTTACGIRSNRLSRHVNCVHSSVFHIQQQEEFKLLDHTVGGYLQLLGDYLQLLDHTAGDYLQLLHHTAGNYLQLLDHTANNYLLLDHTASDYLQLLDHTVGDHLHNVFFSMDGKKEDERNGN